MLDSKLHPVVRDGTVMEYIFTLYFNLLTTVSMVTSNALAVCRFVSIKFPFHEIKKLRALIGCTVAVAVQMALLISYTIAFTGTDTMLIWICYNMQSFYFETNDKEMHFICIRITLFVLLAATGILVSGLSIGELRKPSRVRDNFKKIATVIHYINMYNVISVLVVCVP